MLILLRLSVLSSIKCSIIGPSWGSGLIIGAGLGLLGNSSTALGSNDLGGTDGRPSYS